MDSDNSNESLRCVLLPQDCSFWRKPRPSFLPSSGEAETAIYANCMSNGTTTTIMGADATNEPRTRHGGRRESNIVSVSFHTGKKIIKATSLLFGFLGCPYDLSPLKFCSPEAADSFIWMGATGPGDYSITISDASSAITLRMGNCPSPQPFFVQQ